MTSLCSDPNCLPDVTPKFQLLNTENACSKASRDFHGQLPSPHLWLQNSDNLTLCLNYLDTYYAK